MLSSNIETSLFLNVFVSRSDAIRPYIFLMNVIWSCISGALNAPLVWIVSIYGWMQFALSVIVILHNNFFLNDFDLGVPSWNRRSGYLVVRFASVQSEKDWTNPFRAKKNRPSSHALPILDAKRFHIRIDSRFRANANLPYSFPNVIWSSASGKNNSPLPYRN